MSYFSFEDHIALEAATVEDMVHKADLQQACEKLRQLHIIVYPQLRAHHLDLHTSTKGLITFASPSALTMSGSVSIVYHRPAGQSLAVERLMGRENSEAEQIEARRHPVIELRLTPKHFTIELLLSPDAWWDQQNLMGKLTIARHRSEFYTLLSKLDTTYMLGFWRGVSLNDMHLTAEQMRWPQVLDEWIGTFAPGKDWFRVGTWYRPAAATLNGDNIAAEVLRHIRTLYVIYEHALWTSNNNFRSFYDRHSSSQA